MIDPDSLPDDELWDLVHRSWPVVDRELDLQLLAAYAEGELSGEAARDCEAAIAEDPKLLDLFMTWQRLQADDETYRVESVNVEPQASRMDSLDPGSSSVKPRINSDASRSILPWLLTLAAGTIAIFFGWANFQNGHQEERMASLNRDLVNARLEKLQQNIDVADSPEDYDIWLGRPSGWFGTPAGNTRGATGPVNENLDKEIETGLGVLKQSDNLEPNQVLWLAELEIARNQLNSAESRLTAVAESNRDERWELALANLTLKQALAADPTQGAEELDSAVEQLRALTQSPTLGNQAKFNLATALLVQGSRLRDVDFDLAVEKLNVSLDVWGQLLRVDLPTAQKDLIQRNLKRVEILKNPVP